MLNGKDWALYTGTYLQKSLPAIQAPMEGLDPPQCTATTRFRHPTLRYTGVHKICASTNEKETCSLEYNMPYNLPGIDRDHLNIGLMPHSFALHCHQKSVPFECDISMCPGSKNFKYSQLIFNPQIRIHLLIQTTHHSYFSKPRESSGYPLSFKANQILVAGSILARTALL